MVEVCIGVRMFVTLGTIRYELAAAMTDTSIMRSPKLTGWTKILLPADKKKAPATCTNRRARWLLDGRTPSKSQTQKMTKYGSILVRNIALMPELYMRPKVKRRLAVTDRTKVNCKSGIKALRTEEIDGTLRARHKTTALSTPPIKIPPTAAHSGVTVCNPRTLKSVEVLERILDTTANPIHL